MATDAVRRTRHLVVMGVSGVGKSTVAERLAAELDLELAEERRLASGVTYLRYLA